MSPLRILGVHRGVAALLALLTLSASLLVAGLPQVLDGSYDRAVRQALSEEPPETTDLVVSLRPEWAGDLLTSTGELAEKDTLWRGALPAALRGVVLDGAKAAKAGAFYGAVTNAMPLADRIAEQDYALQFLTLGWSAGADQRVRYVAGSPPGPPKTMKDVPGYPSLGAVPVFDVALSRAGAEAMSLSVGSLLLLGGAEPVLAHVTGLFEPVNPADAFWRRNRSLLRVSIRKSQADEDEQHLTGLIDGSGLQRLRGYNGDLRYQWVLPVDGRAITARTAPALVDALDRFHDLLGERTARPDGRARFELETGLGSALTRFLDRRRTADALMWLVIGGLAVVAFGVVALAVRLLVGRMRPSLALARARGGSLAGVAGVAAGTVAAVCVPAALAGYGLAFLVPGTATAAVHAGPPLIALAAVALAAVFAAADHRVTSRERREDVAARRPSPRRLVAEALVVVLALVGAYLLRTRGLTAAGTAGTAGAPASPAGADPFLLVVPAALALAAALVTLRLYPYPLRLLARLAARRRSAVPFLGLTLAARTGAAGALPVLILLPALAVSVYGVVVADALDSAQNLAAWRTVGATARIERPAGPPGPAVERIRSVPGVSAVLPALTGEASLGVRGQSVSVVGVDLAAYRTLLADGPLTVPSPPPVTSADTPTGTVGDASAPAVPALVTADLTMFSSFELGWHKRIRVVPKGVIDGGLPGLAPDRGGLVVVPYQELPRAGLGDLANVLLVGGDDPDPDLLREAAGGTGVSVVTVRAEADRLANAPLTAAIRTVLRVVTVALAAYAVLSVVIALVAGADGRAVSLSYLRALGLSEGQARNVTVLEVAPVVVCAAVAGLLLGLALPAALGPGIDFSVYAGSPGVHDRPLALTVPVLLTAGLAALAVLGGFAHAAAGRRRSPGSVLRAGDAT
ncbi:FtsX-like permease family protein [Thermopolyspora sp. NPDC052614]|uniref:FtsX-like permease family protein n=1 Tax=Thermopolyspora sp. NPDC052614 TaxID=3155682 RepID=UPI00342A8CFC